MDSRKQVYFKDSLLAKYPLMENLFKEMSGSGRAQALLAMGEAFAMTVAPGCTDPEALLYAAETIRRGLKVGASTTKKPKPTPAIDSPTPVDGIENSRCKFRRPYYLRERG